MRLPRNLIWAFEPSISAIKIYCNKEDIDSIKQELIDSYWEERKKELEKAWNSYDKSLKDFLDEYYSTIDELIERWSLLDESNIQSIEETEYGILFSVGNLTIYDGWDGEDYQIGDFYCLEDVLENIYRKYKNVAIKGYIGYSYSDVLAGDVTQYMISIPRSNEIDISECIGQKLVKALCGKDKTFEPHLFIEMYLDCCNPDDAHELAAAISPGIKKNAQATISDIITKLRKGYLADEEFLEILEKDLNNQTV